MIVGLRFTSQEQPSLGRVAAVLFAMRFADDDGHSVLSNMECNTHSHHLLFRRCPSNRLRVCCSLPTLRDQGYFIVEKSSKFVNRCFVGLSSGHAFCDSANRACWKKGLPSCHAIWRKTGEWQPRWNTVSQMAVLFDQFGSKLFIYLNIYRRIVHNMNIQKKLRLFFQNILNKNSIFLLTISLSGAILTPFPENG